MKVYATKTFRRFQRKEGIADAALVAAVDRADAGMIDADLGGGLIKRGRVGFDLPLWLWQERARQHRQR